MNFADASDDHFLGVKFFGTNMPRCCDPWLLSSLGDPPDWWHRKPFRGHLHSNLCNQQGRLERLDSFNCLRDATAQTSRMIMCDSNSVGI